MIWYGYKRSTTYQFNYNNKWNKNPDQAVRRRHPATKIRQRKVDECAVEVYLQEKNIML